VRCDYQRWSQKTIENWVEKKLQKVMSDIFFAMEWDYTALHCEITIWYQVTKIDDDKSKVCWGLQTNVIRNWGYKTLKKWHVSKRRQITIVTELLKLDEHKISQIEEAPRRCVTFFKVIWNCTRLCEITIYCCMRLLKADGYKKFVTVRSF
jgi:hypothetical protein